METLTDIKDAARATWGSGDYDAMMRQEGLYGVGEDLVRQMAIGPGEEVLDVACGTGNAAIPAAQRGARVTGVDLSPRMLEVARERATRAGVSVDWSEGDAEALPFTDRGFDVVLSTFGCMFAPRHEVVADELARMLRPGGRLGLCTWTLEGAIGDFFRTVAGHLPADPAFVDPPLLWGDEGHVRQLFEGTGVQLSFARRAWRITHDSPAAAVHCYTTTLGPVVQARAHAEAQGTWPQLHDDLLRLFERQDTSGGDLAIDAEYLVITGQRSR